MVAWLTQAKINIWNWALKAVFYFTKGILARNIVSPQANICGRNSLNPPQALIFFWPSSVFFKNLGLRVVRLQQEEGRRWYCGGLVQQNNEEFVEVMSNVHLKIVNNCGICRWWCHFRVTPFHFRGVTEILMIFTQGRTYLFWHQQF